MLYLDGYSLNGVRVRCNCSADALKWHNKVMYVKLSVSSFKKLVV